MNKILSLLTGGDLRSDGLANEVANIILDNDILIGELWEGFNSTDKLIRGRSADALEKISRTKPELVIPQLKNLFSLAKMDNPMMVKMHLAMIFGHVLACDVEEEEIKNILYYLLRDESVFTRSWAIVSLCILARKYPQNKSEIIQKITPMKTDKSVAIRTKASKALKVLLEDDAPFPKGWIKSTNLKYDITPNQIKGL
jgi:hypothetical protein